MGRSVGIFGTRAPAAPIVVASDGTFCPDRSKRGSQRGESQLQNPTQQPSAGAGRSDSDLDGVSVRLNELHAQVEVTEAQILNLERDLEVVAEQEAQLVEHLDAERTRSSVLDEQLREARHEASRLTLKIAFETRDAAVAEAEELLAAPRAEAEEFLAASRAEAEQIAKEASDAAEETFAAAQRESESVVNAGQERLRVAESDAAQRLADLDTEHQAVSEQVRVMEALYDELQATLKLVADTSVKVLAKTRESVKQLEPLETQEPLPESTGEQTTSGTAQEEASVVDLEAPSGLADVEPASIEIPPLRGH